MATLVATIAVIGLAYTFSLGRGFVDRYGVARAAFGVAKARLESCGAVNPLSPDLVITPPPHTAPFVLDGRVIGQESWTVDWVDDPADGLVGAGDPNGNDLKLVTVTVSYQQGALTDSVRLSRMLR